MQKTKNEERKIAAELIPNGTEEIVTDLLYTLFQTMDEYVEGKIRYGTTVANLTKMKNYIEKEMRKYIKILYQVEVEDT